jgi:hypothetical protein
MLGKEVTVWSIQTLHYLGVIEGRARHVVND